MAPNKKSCRETLGWAEPEKFEQVAIIFIRKQLLFAQR